MIVYFQFQYPWVLALLALLPVYSFLLGRTGKRSSLRFPSAGLIRMAGVPARNAPGKLLLFVRLLTAALCITALAGPRMVNERTETQASGVDIMLVLDLSWSMMSLDMADPGKETTRFEIASSVLEDFINKRPNDRIGLIAFSAAPYLASPLTLNHEWLVQSLRAIHVGMIRELGTAIGDATAAAAKRLSTVKDSKSRLIILLTDGDNNQGELEPIEAAQAAVAFNARIYTIGIGLEEPCRLPAFDVSTGKLRHGPNGEIIPTITLQPANYKVLGEMARMGHGRSYRAANRQELQRIYNEIDRLEKSEIKLRRHTTFTPLYQWPLLVALALFAGELALAGTRYRRVP